MLANAIDPKSWPTAIAFFLWLCSALPGCAGPGLVDKDGEETDAGHPYTFVFLTTGERAGDLSAAETAVAGTGHRERIESMGADGTLLLAGPFGEPRTDEDWRGIYVFDMEDMTRARALAQSDPAVVAGLFGLSLMPWRSSTDLGPLRDELERGKRAGDPFVPAAYVLAIGEPLGEAEEALSRLAGQGRVICAGEAGGAAEPRMLALLTAETVEEARAWLESGDTTVRWGLSSLWATALLGALAEGR